MIDYKQNFVRLTGSNIIKRIQPIDSVWKNKISKKVSSWSEIEILIIDFTIERLVYKNVKLISWDFDDRIPNRPYYKKMSRDLYLLLIPMIMIY